MSLGVCVLVNECLTGDGHVAWIVENVELVASHCRRVYADVVLAEEDFIVLDLVIETFAVTFILTAQYVRGRLL